ncbi:MAG: DUF350 domain-containing protein [Phycisphaerae bacterium]
MIAQAFHQEAVAVGWTVVYCVVGAVVGVAIVLAASMFLPRLIDRMTPNIDEEREIARGNTAVGEYFGRVTSAAIIGVSVVVAAAILGGLITVLR